MYYAYIIENIINHTYYVGITSNPKDRWQRHQSNARSSSKDVHYQSYLYSAMRKYGIDNFTFEVIKTFTARDECEQFEIDTIQWFEDMYLNIYNIHRGGTLGFNMQEHKNYWEWKQKLSDNSIGNAKGTPEHDAWKTKLREARAGRQPALGMKHIDENKQLFSGVSNQYWSTQYTYDEDIDEILKLSHKEAKTKFGISTTHYYRLKKRFAINDSK